MRDPDRASDRSGPRPVRRALLRLLDALLSALPDLPREAAERRRREVEEEIAAHIELRADALRRGGLPPDEAHAEALRRMGDLNEVRRTLTASAAARDRSLRISTWLLARRVDVSLTLRRARRSPGYTALAAGTLALGIGVTTAAFAVVDGVLLRPLPFPEPDRLVELWSVTEEGNAFPAVSNDTWNDWAEGNRTLEGTALMSRGSRTFGREGGATTVSTVSVSGAFFDVLRPRMLHGRPFGDEEATSEAPIAVVSEAFWRDAMGGPPLPATITLQHEPREVIGVMAAGTEYPAGAAVWLPNPARRYGVAGAHNWINSRAVGRLLAGVSPEQASEDLSAIARSIRERDPEAIYAWAVDVVPLRDAIVGNAGRQLVLLLGASALVLLVACVNLAGLGVARSTVRAREFAVRSALGAQRDRLAGQLLTEHLLLGLLGGALGSVLAWLAVAGATDAVASFLPRAEHVHVDARVLLFCLAACVGTGVLAGALPAFHTGTEMSGRIARSGRGLAGGGLGRVGAGLVGAQVAIALVLLVGGGLLFRSLDAVLERDLGFDPEGVFVAEVGLSAPAYRLASGVDRRDPGYQRRLAYWRSLLDEARALPEVMAVGLTSGIPTGVAGSGFIEVEGLDEPRTGAGYRAVDGGYFEAMGIPVLQGRTFDRRDGPETERVVVVNERMAAAFWGDASPIGGRVRAISMESAADPDRAEWLTVVGVVGDVRQFGYEQDAFPEMFTYFEQVPTWTGFQNLVVRADPGSAAGLAGALRQTVAALDPELAVEVASLEVRVGAWTLERRFLGVLLGSLAGISLALALVGVYGLLAFAVGQRTHEIGVRAALGATRGRVVVDVVWQGLLVVAAGAVVGLAAATVATRALASMLVDVGPTDPVTFAAATALVLAAAVVAAAAPAWRAARVDPRVALSDVG